MNSFSRDTTVNALINSEKWMIEKLGTAPARIRLFCFHNSGGSADIYYKWRELLPQDVSLCLINLPGRGPTKAIKPLENHESILFGLTSAMLNYLDLPFAFFSFSGGTYIAFDLIHKLSLLGLPRPKHLIVNAGAPVPYIEVLKKLLLKKLLAADAENSIAIFAETGIQQPAIFNDTHKKQIGILLKADLLALLNRNLGAPFKIDTPITVIGNKDDIPTEENLREWAKLTHSEFNLLMVPGKHFELLESPKKYVTVVEEILKTF